MNPFARSCSPDRTPLTFGKFKGMTPEKISDIEPSYIRWMYTNVSDRLCSQSLYNACVDRDDDIDDRDYEDFADETPHRF